MERSVTVRRADIADLNPAILDHIGIWDFARGPADGDPDVIVAVEVLELVDQIIAKQVGPGDAGRVDSGLIERAKARVGEPLGAPR